MTADGRAETQPVPASCAKPGQPGERFVCVPCGLYQGARYGSALAWGLPGLSEHQPLYWRPNTGAPTFLAGTGLVVPVNAWAYCPEPYKRVQPKAMVSPRNPGLGLRVCKADTREAGAQASLRVDRAVQCSLGPLPLGRCGPKAPLPAWGHCSPVMGPRGPTRGRKDQERKVLAGPAEEAGAPQRGSPPTPRSGPAEGHGARAQGKPRFQFLERKYGYFHCKYCKTRWESAYVWCISGTSKVYFKQLCCRCHRSFNPYCVEAIQCQTCSKSRCSCAQKKRHTDVRRPHRQELCGRCKDKSFSCGSIYGIKYIM